MKKSFFCLLCVITLLFTFIQPLALSAFAAPAVGQYDLFVSPDGDDANEGTLENPLASIEAAKEKLKAHVGELDEPVTVWLRGGTYSLDCALEFTADDLPNVAYRAYDGEKVTVSGAKQIGGFTEETVNGVKCFTKQLDTGADGWYFNSLFNGKTRLQTPRFPETGYFTVASSDINDALPGWEHDSFIHYNAFTASPEDVGSEFHNPADVVVRILHYWKDDMSFMSGFDPVTGKISLSRPTSMTVRDIDRYFFLNVFEALNDPGEWYADRRTGTLYYIPFEGETADTLTLYSSKLTALVSIDGANGISFEGITFSNTAWELAVSAGNEHGMDSTQAAYDVKGAFRVKNADGIGIKNCDFLNLGSTAVKMEQNVTNSTVESCYFENIGATGIYIGGGNVPPGTDGSTSNITLHNNEIYKYGRIFFNAVGIQITYCDTAVVSNNEIHDGYYTGISCGWQWGYAYHATRNIAIKDNLIYNIGQGFLSDMGGIYMLGIQNGTVLSGNVIHNVAADASEGGYGGWGIYLDEGSSDMLIEKNLVYCCGSQGLNIHYGEGNVFRNNISALNAEGQVSPGSRDEAHATAFYYNNIFLTDSGAPIYVCARYSEKNAGEHFYENGNLLWDLSLGEKLSFCNGDYREDARSLKAAVKDGVIHNPTVSDPLFKDAKGFDFTLSEDSPAFETGFVAWDYAAAGTLAGTKIGTAKTGGATDVAATSALVTMQKANTSPSTAKLLFAACVLFAALAGVWLLAAKQKRGLFSDTASRLLVVLALMCVTAYYLYVYFLEWNQPLYAATSILLSLLSGIPTAALLGLGKENSSKKRRVLSYIIPVLIFAAVFYALIFVLNSVIIIGNDNACLSVLLLGAVYECVICALIYKRKKG